MPLAPKSAMRIAFVSSYSYLDTVVPLLNALVGHHQIVLYLVSHTNESAITAELHDRSDSGSPSSFLRELDPRVETRPVVLPLLTARSVRSWFVAFKMVNQIRSAHFDVCHIQVFLTQLFPLFICCRCLTVADVHDPFPHPGESRSRFLLPRVRLFLRMCDKVIIHNKTQLRMFASYFRLPVPKISVVPLGVLKIFAAWEQSEVREEEHTILFLGRISPYKGLEYLAEAWKIIRAANPQARLIIAGSGELYFDVHELSADERVELHNRYIENSELVRFIQRASVVVLPYVEATQSGVVMTAYAFNKPVVATNVGGLPEVVEDGVTGYLVPPKDPVALANAIIDLLSNPNERAAFAESISNKVRHELSWTNIAEQTIEVYRSCLGYHRK